MLMLIVSDLNIKNYLQRKKKNIFYCEFHILKFAQLSSKLQIENK